MCTAFSCQAIKRRVAKVRREALARAAAIGRLSDSGFATREREYLKLHPHLAKHRHGGLLPDSDRPRSRVVLPNGIVLCTSWYKVHDVARSLREQCWLMGQSTAPPLMKFMQE